MGSTRTSLQQNSKAMLVQQQEPEDVEMIPAVKTNPPKISARKKGQMLSLNQLGQANLDNTNMDKFSNTMNHCPSSILINDEHQAQL